jgi:hypothetical protein
MLWLPHKQTRKALARNRRRRQRRRMARLLIFAFLLFGLGVTSAPPASSLLISADAITAAYQFDFVDWESQALAGELKRRLLPPQLPATLAEQQKVIEIYLDLEQQIRSLENDLNHAYATNNVPHKVSPSQQQLSRLKTTQAELTPQIEAILTHQLETVLHDEGFLVAGQLFPPVAFRLIDPPTALILSPRDKIENRHFFGLQPGLDNTIRTQIENSLDQRGDISSYVTDIGGLGSYPTMVVNTPNLPALIDIAAHEWTHNYLYTFPTNIAWGYQSYPRLTTINETAATIAGQEISRKVITRFYPNWVDRLPPADESGLPVPREPSEFDLAMRRIRRRIDRLLAEGKIEQAEAYMESERVKLVKKGYNLRRLNQAYFAFHGSYAFGPDSVDPLGPQLRQLRAASPSLKAFLDNVGWLNNDEDFIMWLSSTNIEP